MGKTMAEKILARAAGVKEASPGDLLDVFPHVAMSHENAGLVIKSFKEIGTGKLYDPDRIVIIFDHRVPAESEKTAEGHKTVREFVKKYGIKHFFDINTGICHQVLPEKGFCRPGEVLVGTDSHTTTHGAFGVFSTGIGATEMAAVWATGKLWLMVPETIKIVVKGKFAPGVYAKDLILYIIGRLRADGADYKAIEFFGPAIDEMSIASRMVLTNLSMEAGAKAAMIPPDQKTIEYVKSVTDRPFEAIRPDPDARYCQTLEIDLGTLTPQIAYPHAVDNVKPLAELAGTPIHQALLGSCTNGRLEDLEEGAKQLRGRRVHPDVRMLVIPASWQVYRQALDKGLIAAYIDAGAVVLNPGCGPCLGAHQGLLAAGERCISSTNRNFQGRMGSTQAEVFLASPAAVVASAVAGRITLPEVK
ncbi:MAG: 3-isopropylmalate dehydratase large subunit [Candidatus Ozemobacter sibiricus]|jgi:homoaconitate hydratase family protein|uniref:3-isopropylmalate dehydratase large subunit n=1 Tax=Candidatus Ozemobacter sibiricus TaxID=2268124 RepID=A0A367ZML9_9BACT|nr:MAG: 3-isopropylmalate dehydratase large subunit [Candidatus Ozemobacter sibiricus]